MSYATPDPSSFEDTSHGLFQFNQSVQTAVHNVITSPEITNFVMTMWKVFALSLLMWTLAKFIMGGVEFMDVFICVFMLLFTRALMAQYDVLTAALWGWSEGFASAIQKAGTGQTDLFWLVRFIWNITTGMSFGFSTFMHPIRFFAGLFMCFLAFLLCIMGWFATIWGLWGYALSKMIGYMFIPTLLFEQMSWLFDGWLRFFMGFLIYNVIARANLLLVAVALQSYLGLPAYSVEPIHFAVLFSVNTLAEGMGVGMFLLVSIIALLSTAGFVKAIVGGAHVGPSQGLRTAVAAATGALG